MAGVPGHRTTASDWLRRNSIPTHWKNGNGGKAEYVCLADLPASVRRACLERLVEQAELEMGAYDDGAHAELLKAPLKAQARAHGNADRLLFIVKREPAGLTWLEIESAWHKEFGSFPTRGSVNNWKAKIAGVNPANWAPALVPHWTPGERDQVVAQSRWLWIGSQYRYAPHGGGAESRNRIPASTARMRLSYRQGRPICRVPTPPHPQAPRLLRFDEPSRKSV
jgi:hypothetical protein